jgi:hypothetical protein
MSQRTRCSLAVGLLMALFLALPAPSQAVGLWDPVAPAVWVTRGWSWLESLGLVPRVVPQIMAAPREKTGLAAPGDPSTLTEPPPGNGGPYQGSGIDPNGGVR